MRGKRSSSCCLPTGGAWRCSARRRQMLRRTAWLYWMRRVEDLQKGPYVSTIGRFSQPPRLTDLDGLSLDDGIRTTCAAADRQMRGQAQRRRNSRDARGDRRGGGRMESRGANERSGRRCWRARSVTSPKAIRHTRLITMRRNRYFSMESSPLSPPRSRSLHPRLFTLTNYLLLYPRGDSGALNRFCIGRRRTLGAKPIVSVTHVAMPRAAIRARARR